MVIERSPSGEGSAASESDHEMETGHGSDGEGDAQYDMDYEEEPDFSDPDDFVDDVDDFVLMPDLLRQRPKESDGVDNVILVDGIPAVGAERLEKLKSVLRKIFSKVNIFVSMYIRSRLL